MTLKYTHSLSKQEIDNFIENGFVKIEGAFDAKIAEEGRQILWSDMKKNPFEPKTWTEPVVRLVPSIDKPFELAVNTPRLHGAYHQLVGENWIKRSNAGYFVVRFPSPIEPDDTGWHIDASFEIDGEYSVSLYSRGRALLMLFLFSDVDENDAPTRIRIGSHLDIPPLLVAAGDAGLKCKDIQLQVEEVSRNRSIDFATGKAGDVYLCHPFLVHAAQKNIGKNVKFMAQPPLLNKAPFKIEGKADAFCPVELAILKGLEYIENRKSGG